MTVFIDSNIPMYVAGRDHPLRDPARRFLESVRGGQVQACTSTEVLQEILYRYTGLKRVDLAREVYDLFVQLCPTVLPVTLADTDRAKQLLVDVPGIGARDAVHVAMMVNNDIRRIATFDVGFVRFAQVERVELRYRRRAGLRATRSGKSAKQKTLQVIRLGHAEQHRVIAALHPLLDDAHRDTGVQRRFVHDLSEHRFVDVIRTAAGDQIAAGR